MHVGLFPVLEPRVPLAHPIRAFCCCAGHEGTDVAIVTLLPPPPPFFLRAPTQPFWTSNIYVWPRTNLQGSWDGKQRDTVIEGCCAICSCAFFAGLAVWVAFGLQRTDATPGAER